MLADRCSGSCYLIGWRIDSVDPAIQWAGEEVPWILLHNKLAERCHGSCYPIGWQLDAVDPTTHAIGWRIDTVDPANQWAGG
jgi:hypothetical protein